MRWWSTVLSTALIGLFYFSCSSPRVLEQPVLEQLKRRMEFFDSLRPTALYIFDVPTCLSCGVVGLKALLQRIERLQLPVNIAIIVQVDAAGESKMLWKYFHRSQIIEDSTDFFITAFQITAFPTLVILDPAGKLIASIADPLHHFPSEAQLRQWLTPELDGMQQEVSIDYVGEKFPISTISATCQNPRYESTILLDKNLNQLIGFDYKRHRFTLLWEVTDSLPLHPAVRQHFPNVDLAALRAHGLPFLKLEDIVGCQPPHITLYASAFSLDSVGQPTGQMVLLFFRQTGPNTIRLDSLKPLETDPPSFETMLITRSTPLVLIAQDGRARLLRYHNAQWEKIRVELPFDSTLSAFLYQQVEFPYHRFSSTASPQLCLFSFKFPNGYCVPLTDPSGAMEPHTFPLSTWLTAYRDTLMATLQAHREEIFEQIRMLNLDTTLMIAMPDYLTVIPDTDTTYTLCLPFIRIKADPIIVVERRSLSGKSLAVRRLMVKELLKKDLPRSIALVAANDRRAMVLIKWKKRGWKGYPVSFAQFRAAP